MTKIRLVALTSPNNQHGNRLRHAPTAQKREIVRRMEQNLRTRVNFSKSCQRDVKIRRVENLRLDCVLRFTA